MRGIFLDMLLGRPKPTLELSVEEREELSGFAASRSLPHALVSRAKLVLWSGDGVSNSEIAERLDWSKATVGKWRQRFIEHRIQGLYDELPAGPSAHHLRREGGHSAAADHQNQTAGRDTLERSASGGSQPPVEIHRPPGVSNFCFAASSQQDIQAFQRSVFLSRKYATSWDCTSTLQITPLCSPSMKSRRSKP